MIDTTRKMELEVGNQPHGLVVLSAKTDGKPMDTKDSATLANLLFGFCKEYALGKAIPQVFVTISTLDSIDPLLNLVQMNVDLNRIVIVRTGVPSVHAECRDRIKKRHLGVELRKYMPAS